MYEDDKIKLAKLVAKYERLRKILCELDLQAASVDGRLVEIKRDLPDNCPDDERLPRS